MLRRQRHGIARREEHRGLVGVAERDRAIGHPRRRAPLVGRRRGAVEATQAGLVDLQRQAGGDDDVAGVAAGDRMDHARVEVRHALAEADATVVDRLNILQATHRAMNDALAKLSPPPAHVLVDGLRVKSLRWAQTPLVKGDARSYSIAAASVLAKVTRDRLMRAFDRQFPGYGFAEHKGYGTPAHLAAIARLGPCPIHRRSFAPIRPTVAELALT